MRHYRLAAAISLLASVKLEAGPIYASAWAGAYVDYVITGPTTKTYNTSQPWVPDVVSSSTQGSVGASAINSGGSYLGAVVNSSAAANLALARLSASEDAALVQLALASNGRAEAQAAIGDSFQFRNSAGGLFTWNASHRVRFTMAVSGQVDPATFGTGSSSLSILFGYGTPGALAANGSPLGNRLPAGLVTGGFSTLDGCLFGVGSNQSLGSTNCGGSLSVNSAGVLSGTIFADFNPNGNFDWFTSLQALGWPGFLSGARSSSIDLSHTVDLAFTAPDGAVTYSGSGVFPGTLGLPGEVPEPSTAAMLVLGLGLGALQRRRRGENLRT